MRNNVEVHTSGDNMVTNISSQTSTKTKISFSLSGVIAWIKSKFQPDIPEPEPYFTSKAYEAHLIHKAARENIERMKDAAYFPPY
ncbi:MAG: hypothetical protein ACXAE3_06515 [Candidatus Kariarchaeaceae archaeon]|jgi:hypothetical protein